MIAWRVINPQPLCNLVIFVAWHLFSMASAVASHSSTFENNCISKQMTNFVCVEKIGLNGTYKRAALLTKSTRVRRKESLIDIHLPGS